MWLHLLQAPGCDNPEIHPLMTRVLNKYAAENNTTAQQWCRTQRIFYSSEGKWPESHSKAIMALEYHYCMRI